MLSPQPSNELCNRRKLLRSADGFGMLALRSLLAEEVLADAARPEPSEPDETADLLQPRHPDHPARAKRCIFLFLAGGPSQIDTFNPRPPA